MHGVRTAKRLSIEMGNNSKTFSEGFTAPKVCHDSTVRVQSTQQSGSVDSE